MATIFAVDCACRVGGDCSGIFIAQCDVAKRFPNAFNMVYGLDSMVFYGIGYEQRLVRQSAMGSNPVSVAVAICIARNRLYHI